MAVADPLPGGPAGQLLPVLHPAPQVEEEAQAEPAKVGEVVGTDQRAGDTVEEASAEPSAACHGTPSDVGDGEPAADVDGFHGR